MAPFSEAPDDILLLLPLPPSDIASMIRVCQRFKALFSPRLYGCITLDEYYDGDTRREKPFLECNRNMASRLFSLRKALFNNARLTTSTSGLKLYTDGYWHPEQLSDAEQILEASRFQLSHIAVDGTFLAALGSGELPRLQVLKVTGCSWWRQPAKPVDVLFRVLAQPRMRSLELHGEKDANMQIQEAHCIYTAEPFDLLSDPVYRSNTGKEIILNGPRITDEDVDNLLAVLPDLEAFIFVRWNEGCTGETWAIRDDDPRHVTCIGSSIPCLNKTLKQVCHSLEKLVIIRNCDRNCKYDIEALDSLAGFVKLRNLRVDDSFLLGSHLSCSQHALWNSKQATESREPLDFAKLLPSSLERLDLHVSQGELVWNPRYLDEFLEGLLPEKSRLQDLAHVSIQETPDCVSGDYLPRRCIVCCTEGREGHDALFGLDFTPEPATTETFVRNMQQQCHAVGTRLDYTKREMIHYDRENEWPYPPPFMTRVYEPGRPPKEVRYASGKSSGMYFAEGWKV